MAIFHKGKATFHKGGLPLRRGASPHRQTPRPARRGRRGWQAHDVPRKTIKITGPGAAQSAEKTRPPDLTGSKVPHRSGRDLEGAAEVQGAGAVNRTRRCKRQRVCNATAVANAPLLGARLPKNTKAPASDGRGLVLCPVTWRGALAGGIHRADDVGEGGARHRPALHLHGQSCAGLRGSQGGLVV